MNVAGVISPSDSPRKRGERADEARWGKYGKLFDTTRNGKAMHRAHNLRRNMTKAEAPLWNVLRGKQVAGFKFRRQQSIGPFIVDFVCMGKLLITELDGGEQAEQSAKDQSRTRLLEEIGYEVIRFWNNEEIENIDGVIHAIAEKMSGL